MEYTFISYSRTQLYFAEAIALHLQKRGFEIWFDLQQLGAGVNWASTLEAGYENCRSLILVVSQSALASKYVEAEWNTAQQNGREVILAVVEAADIPERLQECAVIDFRTDFDGAMKRLAAYLTGNGPAPKDHISAPGKFPYPLHLPFPIWFPILSWMWPYAWAMVVSLSLVGINPLQTVFYFVLGSLGLGVLTFVAGVRRFLKHDLDHRGVRHLGLFAFTTQLVVTVVALARSLIVGSLFWIAFVPIVICFLLNVYFSLWFVHRSAALLRWFAAGQVPQELRRQCHAGLLGKDVRLGRETFESEPVEFFLYSDPADRPMARSIAQALTRGAHHEVDEMSEAQKHLYLITNRTSKKIVEEAADAGTDSNIFLLGSSINWSKSLESAGKTQFVDLREMDTNDINVFAGSLSNMALWRRQYALEATPTKFETFVAPTSVQVYRFLAYLQVVGFLDGGLILLLNRSWPDAILRIVLGFGIFFLVERALQRRVPWLVALGVLAGLPLISVFYGQFFAAILNLLVTVVVLYRARAWFPSFAPLAKDALGVGKDVRSRTWGRVFVAVATLINLVIYLLSMRSGS